METSTAQELRDAALEGEKTTAAELREYSNFKTELRKYGISIEEDTRKFVQVIYGIKQHGYDVNKVLSEYSDLEFKQVKRELLNNQVRQLEDKIMNLQHQCSFLESKVNLHDQRLYVYDELKLMGLALRQLKIICNTIKEIAAENNISLSEELAKFFEFLEQRYDIKLRQKVLEDQQQKLTTTKSYNLTTTYPYYPDDQPFTTSPERSALEEQERQRQIQSISYEYRELMPSLRQQDKKRIVN
jgi:hypothetical protein